MATARTRLGKQPLKRLMKRRKPISSRGKPAIPKDAARR